MFTPWEAPRFPTEAGRPAPAESASRILVVDDEATLRRALVALLQRSDRQIDSCGSVAEALAQLNTGAYDLLILDYRLPDASGLAVMDWLIGKDRHEAVIMISGERSVDATVAALRRGAIDFLLKPFPTDQLRRAVDRALDRRRQERHDRIARQRLQFSEQMHRYLVENSLDLIYTLDAEGRFRYLNRRCESLLGHPRKTLIGQHFSEIVHPEDLERACFTFNERRTGPRATHNMALRLARNPYGSEGAGPVAVMLNAMGLYGSARGGPPRHFIGTYGAAHCPPAPTDVGDRPRSGDDGLTGLPKREVFIDRLTLAIAQSRRRKTQLAVMAIDLDRFGQVNEAHGRGEGDVLLRAVAQRLQQCLRHGDTVTRKGCDEFIVLLPDIGSQANGRSVAEKLLRALRAPFSLAIGELRITASVGIAMHPEDGEHAEDLVQHASIAMHQVKGEGRDAWACFTPEMHTSYRTRMALGRQLCGALARGELELHYQPLVSPAHDRITAMEALVRWRHPAHGLIAPARFLHIAEKAGIMHSISLWVLETACARLAGWRRRFPGLRLTINLSSLDFEQPGLTETIARILAHNELPAASLELDIAEGLLLGQREEVSAALKGLRELGVGLAIHDFGTGYSALASLSSHGVTRLKVDRSFVADIRGKHLVVSAIAGIARGFGIPLGAEGVERCEQLASLEALGCDEMQGFLFAGPVDADAATRLLSDFRPSSRLPRRVAQPVA